MKVICCIAFRLDVSFARRPRVAAPLCHPKRRRLTLPQGIPAALRSMEAAQ
jgi:hypothetical protein